MNQRFDVGAIGQVEKTPTGGIRVQAHLARTGILVYDDGKGGQVREYVPPDELFSADSIATLPDAPLTVGHPAGMVSPDNHSDLSQGHVRSAVADGDKLSASVAIQGKRAIRAVEKGLRQVSCGYTCTVDEAPGTSPSGEQYDRVQRNRRYNHVALVDAGRAGPDVRLRLDSQGNQTSSEPEMKTERIDGVDYEIGTPGHVAACQRRDASEVERKAKLDAMNAEKAKLSADLEVARADKAKLDAEIAQLKDPARIDAAVTARATLIDSARKVLGAEAKFDGCSDLEIKRQVAAKAYPNKKFDLSDTVRIDSFYEAACEHVASSDERADEAAHANVRVAILKADAAPTDIADKARFDMLKRNRDAWKEPLATSVGK